jgi:hypothetical protein
MEAANGVEGQGARARRMRVFMMTDDFAQQQMPACGSTSDSVLLPEFRERSDPLNI